MALEFEHRAARNSDLAADSIISKLVMLIEGVNNRRCARENIVLKAGGFVVSIGRARQTLALVVPGIQRWHRTPG